MCAHGRASPDPTLAPPTAWWAYPLIAVGAGLLGLVIATYVSAPTGAEPTFCDLRLPALGIAGVALAVASPSSPISLPGIVGAGPGLAGSITQPVLGAAALALLYWALVERLGREREATAVTSTGEEARKGVTCSTCRPLFPTRAPRHGYAPEEIDGIGDHDMTHRKADES